MDSVSTATPLIYVVRHGETTWTTSGQHTSLTDLPLTKRGEGNARSLGERMKHVSFAKVFSSPLKRVLSTCELAGFGTSASIDDDLLEWNYGAFEGKSTAEIRRQYPGWELFRDGCPGGESPSEVGVRADRVVRQLRAIEGNVLVFSSGHFLRVLAARWLSLEPATGRYFFLGTAALSILGYEHDGNEPVIRLWNDCGHKLGDAG